MSIGILILLGLSVAALCAREVIHGGRETRTLADICRMQAEQLMYFHKAGQSMASHQIQQMQATAEAQRAEADRIRAEVERDEFQRRMADRSEPHGKFNGRPKVVAPYIQDDQP